MYDENQILYFVDNDDVFPSASQNGEIMETQGNNDIENKMENQEENQIENSTETVTEIQNNEESSSSTAFPGIGSLLWFACGLAIPLAAIGIKTLIKKSGTKKATPAFLSEPHVEKLHELGARKNQQDCFAVSPPELAKEHGLLMVVADGMGGLSDGDKISQAAVGAALNAFFSINGTPEQVLLGLLAYANRAVYRLSGSDGTLTGGTTILMGLLKDNMFYYLSVGDSRICLYRDGQLYQLNREHIYRMDLALSAVNGEISIGEVYSHQKGDGLTSYLGMGTLKYIDLPAKPLALLPGDKIILMSDGVYNALTTEEFTAALDAGTGKAADALHSVIKSKGYARQDNYTALILSC